MSSRFSVAIGATLLCACAWTTVVRADIIAADAFACRSALIATQSGGEGWNGAWLSGQPDVFRLLPDSLAVPRGPRVSGGSAKFDGSHAAAGTGARRFRSIDLSPSSVAARHGLVEVVPTTHGDTQPALGKPGTTVWLSFLINGGTAGNGQPGVANLAQLHLYLGVDTSRLADGDQNKDGEVLALGRGNLNTAWNYERTCAHDRCPSGEVKSKSYVSALPFDDRTHWVVMRMVFANQATSAVTLWLDPAPGRDTPPEATALILAGQTTNTIDGLHFNAIEFGGQTASFAFDEIRLGTSFRDLSARARQAACRP